MRMLVQILLMMLVAAPALFSADKVKPSCCEKALEGSSSLPDRSVYQVDSVWTNDARAIVHLSDLRGKPQVIAMFFANCAYACPIIVHDMQKIESALPEDIRAKVGFTLVSFDTERDTPKVLSNYRKQHKLNKKRWTLLRGKPDDVLELAALLGVKFKKDAQGQFSHSNLITLLNSDGEVIKQQVGLNKNQKETTQMLLRLFETQSSAESKKTSR